jgi:hypothetical protein
VGRPRLDRAEIIRRAMTALDEAGEILPSVRELTRRVDVTDPEGLTVTYLLSPPLCLPVEELSAASP